MPDVRCRRPPVCVTAVDVRFGCLVGWGRGLRTGVKTFRMGLIHFGPCVCVCVCQLVMPPKNVGRLRDAGPLQNVDHQDLGVRVEVTVHHVVWEKGAETFRSDCQQQTV